MTLNKYLLLYYGKLKSFLKLKIIRKKYYSKENYSEKNYPITKRPIFYIIRRGAPDVGIFSCILTFLSHIRYAETKGYIPIIDMMHFDNEYIYNDSKEFGNVNAWEYYFKQPGNCSTNEQYSLREAYLNKKAILSTGEFCFGYEPSVQFLDSVATPDTHIWKTLWERYRVLNDATANHIEEVYHTMFSVDDRVMGVLCRGSDYFWHESVQGNETGKITLVLDRVDAAVKEYHCNKIFLMTEDSDILEKFKDRFGKILYFLDDERVSSDTQDFLGDVWKRKRIDLYQKGLNYITGFYIITKCRWFIGTKTSASVFFDIVGEKEYAFYFNLNEL
ncbi:MAG: hypothetical protein LBV33_07250 [Lachnospiraceae bacterium]|jgi:hypothetical protein|nr:hypothetical protein [Lachnospiraceae bacterium]